MQSVCSRLCLRRLQLWGQSWMRSGESTRVSWESSPDWSRDMTTSGKWVCWLRFGTHPQNNFWHSNKLCSDPSTLPNSAPRATEGQTLPIVWTLSLHHPLCCRPSLSPHFPFHLSHLPFLRQRRFEGLVWHLPPLRGECRCGGLKPQWWEDLEEEKSKKKKEKRMALRFDRTFFFEFFPSYYLLTEQYICSCSH